MIGILDYGVGNLASVLNGLKYFNPDKDIRIVSTCYELAECSKLLLPGVGAFGDARRLLEEKNLDRQIRREAEKGKLILGICLGMQLLCSKGYESGETLGLDLIPGEVVRFNDTGVKIPHMGWNSVKPEVGSPLFRDIQSPADFYFVHSYHFKCDDQANVLATAEHGGQFVAAVCRDNVFGIQFHPEKSQRNGLIMLRNFVELPDA